MQVGMPLLPVTFAMPSIDQIWLMRSTEGIVSVCERLVTLLPCRKWVGTLSGGMAFWCCQAIVVLSVDFRLASGGRSMFTESSLPGWCCCECVSLDPT